MFLIAVAVLIGRLYQIQVIDHKAYLERARAQSEANIVIPAIRGTIFDSKKEPLAVTLQTPSIYVDPTIINVPVKARKWIPEVLGVDSADFRKFLSTNPDAVSDVTDPNRDKVISAASRFAAYMKVNPTIYINKVEAALNQLRSDAAQKAAPILNMSVAQVEEIFQRDRRFVWVKRPADQKCGQGIRELKIRGLCVADEKRRHTAEDIRLGQWLGFVNDAGVGSGGGLELIYDKILCGTPGSTKIGRDGRGRTISLTAQPDVPPKHGSNLYLTIDARLQLILNEELNKIAEEFTPVAASGIIMEPSTGRILAIDCIPGLKLSEKSSISSKEELERRLRNHPVQSCYEYGSTFKPFIAAAVIDCGLATPATRIHCENGLWAYRGRRLRDTHSYGILTVADVIAFSSNIGAGKMGLMLGDVKLQQYLAWYGFGRKTGIELPGEEAGLVTKPANWSYYTTTSVPMGQEIAGTPLQLITGFAALVNGGRLLQPYIVEAIEDPNTGSITRRGPIELRRVIKPQTSAIMREIMGGVVTRGTGQCLKNAAFEIGGKTGTAQKATGGTYSHSNYIASFVGFAPVNNPRIIVLVMVDEPHGRYYGGSVSAPAVGRIIDRSLLLIDSTQRKTQPVASVNQQGRTSR